MNVLITDGESDHALNILHCFRKRRDLKIFILSNKRHPIAKFSRHYNKFQFHSCASDSVFVKYIESYVLENNIDMLFPVDEEGIQLIALHKIRFEKSCNIALIPEYEISLKVSDKWSFYNTLKCTSVKMPDTFLIDDVNNKSFPLILKPRKGKSGSGIHLINNTKQLNSLNIIASTYIAQSYINGYDIDCSFIAKKGNIIAIIVQKPLKKNNDLDFGPSKNIEILHNKKIKELIKTVVKELAWDGVGHADLRYCSDTDTFNLIEINPRYWSSILASLAAGVNFPLLAIEHKKDILITSEKYRKLNYLSINDEIKRLITNKKKDNPTDFSTLYHFLGDPFPYLVYKFNSFRVRYFS
tara:strand:- start:70 stop:1134 length:1065 start_codon:yes stop_codon:yes gene_type:complete